MSETLRPREAELEEVKSKIVLLLIHQLITKGYANETLKNPDKSADKAKYLYQDFKRSAEEFFNMYGQTGSVGVYKLADFPELAPFFQSLTDDEIKKLITESGFENMPTGTF